MRERHNWAAGKHPKTCTCAVCTRRRLEAGMPRSPNKKRKPKSLRGQSGKDGNKGSVGKETEDSSALAEAMDILTRSQLPPENDPETGDEPHDD
jgi:hypothetical protein